MKKIAAVIVTYNPESFILQSCISSIYEQVDIIILVKNSIETINYDNRNNNKIEIIQLEKNYGIAYAQNKGIKRALALNSDYILLSDQDTIYPEYYVRDIFSYSSSFIYDVLCPVFFDNIKNEYSPIMLTKFSYINKITKPTYVEHTIASGTIIKASIIPSVGMMDERLFIDYVDFEWCWRLKDMDMKILCVPQVIINHTLGDACKKILGIKVTIRSNFRYYYMIRNGCYLVFFCNNLKFHERILLLNKTFRLSIAIFLLRTNKKTIFLIIKAWLLGFYKKLGQSYL